MYQHTQKTESMSIKIATGYKAVLCMYFCGTGTGEGGLCWRFHAVCRLSDSTHVRTWRGTALHSLLKGRAFFFSLSVSFFLYFPLFSSNVFIHYCSAAHIKHVWAWEGLAGTSELLLILFLRKKKKHKKEKNMLTSRLSSKLYRYKSSTQHKCKIMFWHWQIPLLWPHQLK